MRSRTGAGRLRSTAQQLLPIPHPPWVPKEAQAPPEKPKRQTRVVGIGVPQEASGQRARDRPSQTARGPRPATAAAGGAEPGG